MVSLQSGLTKPLLCHRVNIVPIDCTEETHLVNAQNQYLQIFLESGLIGIICFVIFLFGIWKAYQKSLGSNIVRWAGCFFLGILVYQSTEISLIFNIEAIELIHWSIIGIGLSTVYYSKVQNEVDRKVNYI